MKKEEDQTLKEVLRELRMASRVLLASSLISNATAAMTAENRVRELGGKAPAFSADAIWSEIPNIYDQLGLPHDEGMTLTWRLFDK